MPPAKMRGDGRMAKNPKKTLLRRHASNSFGLISHVGIGVYALGEYQLKLRDRKRAHKPLLCVALFCIFEFCRKSKL